MQPVEALPKPPVHEQEREIAKKRSLLCTFCGYGVFRSAPPERCPMCQAENTWIHAPRRTSVISVADC